MNIRTQFVALQTILIKETLRFLRIWIQTILPPAVTKPEAPRPPA